MARAPSSQTKTTPQAMLRVAHWHQESEERESATIEVKAARMYRKAIIMCPWFSGNQLRTRPHHLADGLSRNNRNKSESDADIPKRSGFGSCPMIFT